MNVILTGAASGIGAAIWETMREAGWRVNAVDLAFPPLAFDLGHNHRVFARDVTKDNCLQEAISSFGLSDPPDLLVNCAGVAGRRAFHNMDRQEWDRVLSVNLWGTANCCQQYLRFQMASGSMGGAAIVNIASMTGQIGNGEGFINAHYAASKAGVVGLTKALAIEYAPYKIRVNAVLPGPIMTPMLQKFRDEYPEMFADFIGRVPLGKRPGKPEDVAQAVMYLAQARWVTGVALFVDGGYSAA